MSVETYQAFEIGLEHKECHFFHYFAPFSRSFVQESIVRRTKIGHHFQVVDKDHRPLSILSTHTTNWGGRKYDKEAVSLIAIDPRRKMVVGATLSQITYDNDNNTEFWIATLEANKGIGSKLMGIQRQVWQEIANSFPHKGYGGVLTVHIRDENSAHVFSQQKNSSNSQIETQRQRWESLLQEGKETYVPQVNGETTPFFEESHQLTHNQQELLSLVVQSHFNTLQLQNNIC